MDEFFAGFPVSQLLFDTVCESIKEIDPIEQRVTKSQIVLKPSGAKKAFAWMWIPEKHLHRKAAPLVLSLSFPFQDDSPRWKQIVEPVKGRFMHHLEIDATEEIDEEVRGWLREAWRQAG